MTEVIYAKELRYVINPVLASDQNELEQIKHKVEKEVDVIVTEVRRCVDIMNSSWLLRHFPKQENGIAFEVEILRKLTP